MKRFLEGLYSTPAMWFSIYVGFSVLSVLDGTLARMHEPGGASAGATSIASYSSALQSDASAAVIAQWNAWYGLPDAQGLSLVSVLLLYFVTDIAVIALPLLLLLLRANSWVDERVDNFPTGTKVERDGLRQQLSAGRQAAMAYFVFDVAEGAFLVLAGSTGQKLPIFLVGVASIGKWLSLAWALTALVIGLLLTPEMRRMAREGRALNQIGDGQLVAERKLRGAWGQVLAVRAHIAVAALLFVLAVLPGPLGRQLDDAFLLLYDDWLVGVMLVVTAAVLVAVMYQTAKFCVHAYRDEPGVRSATTAVNIWLIVIGIFLAAAGGFATWREWVFGTALVVPGVLLFLLGFVSFFTVGDSQLVVEVDSSDMTRGMRLAVELAVVPIVVLIALSARNGVRLLTIQESRGGLGLILLALVGVPVAIGFMTFLTREDRLGAAAQPRTEGGLWRPAFLAGLSIATFVGMAFFASPIGQAVGPWAIVFIFGTAVVLVLSALVLLGDRMRPYGVISRVGLRRTPLIVALIICFVGTSAIDSDYGYHATRLLPTTARDRLAIASERNSDPNSVKRSALDQWASAQLSGSGDRPDQIPIVFVASAGGGIRAAYWTSLVLGCLIRQQELSDVPSPYENAPACSGAVMDKSDIFLASGISGGSLGLATMIALDHPHEWTSPLREDFLGPAIAGLAFRDIPNSLVRLNIRDEDRAAILERSWEDAANELRGGFLDRAISEDGSATFPLLALSGSSVADGCRVTVSALDLARPIDGVPNESNSAAKDCLALDEASFQTGSPQPVLPATKDAFDNTCESETDSSARDIALSTAALLSARFPYVSPTGTLFSCSSGGRTFDLDGGLIDASGALPLAQLWPEIVGWLERQPVCFAPKLILIENGYLPQTASTPASRPAELTAPITGVGTARDAIAPASRQAAALAFEASYESPACAKVNDATSGSARWTAPNVVDFYPVAKPGIEAPLGWTLSSFSQTSLDQQLRSSFNQCSAEIVAAWFKPVSQEPKKCEEARKTREMNKG